MSLQEAAEAILHFVQNNQAWAAPIVFALAFAESLAFLSLIVPATFILVGIAGLLSVGGISFWPVLLAAWAGSAVGYSVSYWIGYYFKDSIHRIWPFTTHPYLLPRGQQFFDKFGVMGVFLGHFFGPIRAVIPVIAGMFGMEQVKFQIANITSSAIWSAAVLSPAILGIELLLKITAVLAAVLAIALGLAYALQRKLMYFPDTERIAPATAGLPNVKEITLAAADANRLICWYGKAADENKPTILYFHGNAGNINSRSGRVAAYMERGYGIFVMSYRGYNGSTGSPSQVANVADAATAYDYLRTAGIAPDKIIIYGESLGTGVAVEIAGRHPSAGLILDSPYTSMVDVAALHYPYLPVTLLLRDRYETMKHIAAVKTPLLVLHGEADQVIPIEMGRSVFEAANEPKTFHSYPDVGHIEHWQFGSYDDVFKWLRSLAAAAKP